MIVIIFCYHDSWSDSERTINIRYLLQTLETFININRYGIINNCLALYSSYLSGILAADDVIKRLKNNHRNKPVVQTYTYILNIFSNERRVAPATS